MSAECESEMRPISRRTLFRFAAGSGLAVVGFGVATSCANSAERARTTSSLSGGIPAVLYRQIGCSCCATYADYLRQNGFRVRMTTVEDLGPIREKQRIPDAGVGCHTSVIDDYVVEGHVPVEAISRLLSERPSLDGISVVGMPINSPGMGAPNGQPLPIMSFKDGQMGNFMSVTTY